MHGVLSELPLPKTPLYILLSLNFPYFSRNSYLFFLLMVFVAFLRRLNSSRASSPKFLFFAKRCNLRTFLFVFSTVNNNILLIHNFKSKLCKIILFTTSNRNCITNRNSLGVNKNLCFCKLHNNILLTKN